MCCLFGIVLHKPNPGHRLWSVKRRWTSTDASCIKVRSRSVPQPPPPPRLSLIPKKIQITNCKWFSIVQTQATKIQAYLQLNYLLTNTSNFQAAFGVEEITLATWSYKAWQGTYFYCVRNGRKGTLLVQAGGRTCLRFKFGLWDSEFNIFEGAASITRSFGAKRAWSTRHAWRMLPSRLSRASR